MRYIERWRQVYDSETKMQNEQQIARNRGGWEKKGVINKSGTCCGMRMTFFKGKEVGKKKEKRMGKRDTRRVARHANEPDQNMDR